MRFSGLFRAALLGLSLIVLSACDSAEERAEKHYQKGIELLESGDVDRALVEFRNVFKLNGKHLEARKTYAQAVLEQGKVREAFGQYLRLVEQYPDDVEGNRALAELAIRTQQWDEAKRYGDKALELDPEDPRIRVIGAALAYRDAVTSGGADDRRAVLAEAQKLQTELPDSEINRSVIIDALVREGDDPAALAEIDETLAMFPENLNLYRLRLQILSRMGNDQALEEQLRDMVEKFPDDEASKALLIRYYMSKQDLDGAEAFLRAQIVEGEPDDAKRMTLIQFLSTARGKDAARAELDKFIEEGTNDDRFRAMRAVLDFDMGKKDEAIAEIQRVVEAAEPSDQSREIKVMLARLLVNTGNEVGARALVEEVLAEDPSMVEALKMQAAWLIDADRADEAINVLRRALDQSPNDPVIMTIMSGAHLRNGDRELAGELLSLAVEASNGAPAESIRHARFLVESGKLLPAEGVLVAALRLSPDNPALLAELGGIYVRLEDWPRADQVERTLRRLGTDATTEQADRLKVAILNGENRNSDALTFLEDLEKDEDTAIGAQIAIIRTHLAAGEPEKARSFLNQLLAEQPDNPTYQFLDAALLTTEGNFKGAEQRYRALLAKNNKLERIWIELVRTLTRDGRRDEALAALNEALEILPDGRDLLWAKASLYEQQKDYDAAIEIYERLYEENTSTSIVANNLASLLSTQRTDPESLERAYAVARRLRGTDFPPFQDTYGWIAYLRGDYEDALKHLEPAAAGMADDPQVQYHLGMTYLALKREDKALAQLKKALEVAGDDPRPEFETARQEVERLGG